MNKICFIIFFLSLTSLNLHSTNEFKLCSSGCKSDLRLNIHTDKNIVSKLSLNSKIKGLSIDGKIIRRNSNYLVRIILQDTNGIEYLVLESYKELNDNDSICIDNYCEETAFLDGINVESLNIYIKGAYLSINQIHYITDDTTNRNWQKNLIDNLRIAQIKEIVNRINIYNKNHQKLWRAGLTDLSKKRYSEKKRILGIENDTPTGGMEYYTGGIFEIGDDDSFLLREEPTISYIDHFDWRNRHGKNWITPNKNQGNSGYCYFFASVACVEAMTNLYYNRILNYDLSEQELACCSGIYNPYYGVGYYQSELQKPLNYLISNGICDEQAYPFVDDPTQTTCLSSEITPNEKVSISDFKIVDNTCEDSIKKALINHGPLISGWRYWGYNPDSTTYRKNHSMLVVGFGVLQEGDTIFYYVEPNGHGNGAFTASPGHPCIGKTYWIYKNSYGLSQDEARQGYMYIIHYNYSKSFNYTYYCSPPVSTMNYSNSDVICSDEDGDGYYYWGIGQKPAYCPSWVPDTPDGNDNDAERGPMDEYGYLEEIDVQNNPTHVISGTETITTPTSMDACIRIPTNTTFIINSILNLFGHVTITIEGNGELIIDGGVISNAMVNITFGGKITIKNGGKMVLRTNTIFEAPIGSIIKIENGEICKSTDFK